MRFLVIVFFLLSAISVFAQQKKYTYYDKLEKEIDSSHAASYSVEYFDNAVHRIYREYYKLPFNQITRRAYYINDSTVDGLSVNYFDNGNISDSCVLNSGTRTGLGYFFYSNGKLASIVNFDNTKPSFVQCFSNAGKQETCNDSVETMPEFPGGIMELKNFLVRNIKYPKTARENGIEGKVVVKFYVDVDGTIHDVLVIKNADVSLDAEAVRVINSMPKWIPGVQFHRAVKVYYTLPITFKLG